MAKYSASVSTVLLDGREDSGGLAATVFAGGTDRQRHPHGVADEVEVGRGKLSVIGGRTQILFGCDSVVSAFEGAAESVVSGFGSSLLAPAGHMLTTN